jgi:hypothetical protein
VAASSPLEEKESRLRVKQDATWSQVATEEAANALGTAMPPCITAKASPGRMRSAVKRRLVLLGMITPIRRGKSAYACGSRSIWTPSSTSRSNSVRSSTWPRCKASPKRAPAEGDCGLSCAAG